MYVFMFLVTLGWLGGHLLGKWLLVFRGVRCLIVGLVLSHLDFWSGNLFLIAPFPDLCLLVPFYTLD